MTRGTTYFASLRDPFKLISRIAKKPFDITVDPGALTDGDFSCFVSPLRVRVAAPGCSSRLYCRGFSASAALWRQGTCVTFPDQRL